VEFCSSINDVAEQWTHLCERAAPNVFMNPAALNAARETGFSRLHVLLAWLRGAQPDRLVGVWALQETHLPLQRPFLTTTPYEYSYLSAPVVDPEFEEEVIAAFFDAVERDSRLPKVLRMRYLDGEFSTYPAILKVLTERHAQTMVLSQRPRPFATRAADPKSSGATRRKLRQKWKRMCEAGTVDIQNDRSTEAARSGFEIYLDLEAASWKGERGTAVLCHAADATFMRRLMAVFASERKASVAVLRLNGRPIASQVLLYCGRIAYTWKTSFDATYGAFSLGMLLVDKVTEQLLADDTIDGIESCPPEGGFLNELWNGRRNTVDLLADLGAHKSLDFTAVAVSVKGYAHLRAIHRKLRKTSEAMKLMARSA
jgi:CelD/BcsL family acetyltransferase involved in cellulose biosynthesis